MRRATLADTHRTSTLQEGTMALRVMSADSHMDLIYLPPDTFALRMAGTWGDAVPHVVERDGRKWWVSGDAVLGPYGVYGPGVTGGKRGRILAEAGFATGKQTRPSNPVERREDQPRDRLQAEEIYGVIRVSRGLFTHAGISHHPPPPGGHRRVDDRRADADGRGVRVRDPLRRVRAPPAAAPRPG